MHFPVRPGQYRMRNGRLAMVDGLSKHGYNYVLVDGEPRAVPQATVEIAWGESDGNRLMWDPETGCRSPKSFPEQDLIARIDIEQPELAATPSD